MIIMKTILRHIISFSLILILLVSALQVSLYKMECLMSGNIQISLSSFDDCNKTTKESNSISQKCCDFHDIILDFDYDSNNLKQVKVLTSPIATLKLNTVSVKPITTNTEFSFYTNLPPPSGYELLKLVQVFTI